MATEIEGDLKDNLTNLSYTFSKHLKVVHSNAESLNCHHHYSEFCLAFSSSNIDVIAVSETFFNEHSLTHLNNYTEFTCDRPSGRASGGVALYIKDCYKAKLLVHSKGERFRPEYVVVEVIINNEKILFACIYRPPDVGFLNEFIDDLYCFLPLYKYAVVCGDVNGRFGSGSYETKNVEETFELCNLSFVPFGPTFHINNCHSKLDVIASNCSDLLLHSEQRPVPGFSAHDLLFAVFNFSVPKIYKKEVHLEI